VRLSQSGCQYAESFGAKGYRIERASDLEPTLKQALADNTVAIIDCPVDYSENMILTEKLSTLKSPLWPRPIVFVLT
jgi:acetolactate synthase I/II/III large subunit